MESESGRGEACAGVTTTGPPHPTSTEIPTSSSTPPAAGPPAPPKTLKAKKKAVRAAAAAEADFERLCRRDPLSISRRELFCTDGVWDTDRLADAHSRLNDAEEADEDELFLERMGFEDGSRGFDRPPPDLGDLGRFEDLSQRLKDSIEWGMAASGFKDESREDGDDVADG